MPNMMKKKMMMMKGMRKPPLRVPEDIKLGDPKDRPPRSFATIKDINKNKDSVKIRM